MTPGGSILIALSITPATLEAIRRGSIYWLKRKKYIRATEIVGDRVRNKDQLDAKLISFKEGSPTLFPNVEHSQEISIINPKPGHLHFLTGHDPYLAKLFNI